MADPKVPFSDEIARPFVGKSHGDLEYVKHALAAHPALANACVDWGGGDWESAIGAAAHMGRRDIALLLMEHGARTDVFVAAMLGQLAVVKAAIEADPAVLTRPGPHGISLTSHARGAEAKPVKAYLQSLAKKPAKAAKTATAPARKATKKTTKK